MKTCPVSSSYYSDRELVDRLVASDRISQYPLAGRVFITGVSLIYLTEAVIRVVTGYVSYLGYALSIGCWQRAKQFGVYQTDRGSYAGAIGFACLYSVISPEKFEATVSDIRFFDRYKKFLPEEVLSYRIREGETVIAKKLEKQLEYAKRQADFEPNKRFAYLTGSATFLLSSESGRIADYEVGICHFMGRRLEMEDEHLATEFTISVAGCSYPVQLFGVFDGHGGNRAACYVKNNLERQVRETLEEFCKDGLTDVAIWNALKISFVKLHEEFQEPGFGTTVAAVMILDGKLWTANVGDSRVILDNGIQLSEDAKPDDLRYAKGIERRKGEVKNHRVNGVLAVARAIGDHDIVGVNPRPKITAYPLSKISAGSHILLACDGIYDVASTRQVAAAVRSDPEQSPSELAKNIVFSAYEAGSGDNLSVLVVKLPGVK